MTVTDTESESVESIEELPLDEDEGEDGDDAVNAPEEDGENG